MAHCPKDGTTKKAKKTTKTTKVSGSRSIPSEFSQKVEENNAMLRFVITKDGYDVEEVLCPITKKYSPSFDDKDIKPEEEGEDEELLNWDKKPTEEEPIVIEEIEERIVIKEVKEEIKTKEPIVVEEVKEEFKTEEPIVVEENKAEEPIVIEEAKEEIKIKEPVVIEENKVKEPVVIKEAKTKEPTNKKQHKAI